MISQTKLASFPNVKGESRRKKKIEENGKLGRARLVTTVRKAKGIEVWWRGEVRDREPVISSSQEFAREWGIEVSCGFADSSTRRPRRLRRRRRWGRRWCGSTGRFCRIKSWEKQELRSIPPTDRPITTPWLLRRSRQTCETSQRLRALFLSFPSQSAFSFVR